MQTDTAVHTPPSAGGLGADLRESLPPLFVGEKPEVKREHEWPGNLFFVLSYIAAVGMGAGALGCLATGLFTLNPGIAGLGLGLGVGAAVQWRLAGEVQNFSRWGWYGAMIELTAASAAKLWAMAQGNFIGGAIGLCIDLAWLGYFWERRDQFDVDL